MSEHILLLNPRGRRRYNRRRHNRSRARRRHNRMPAGLARYWSKHRRHNSRRRRRSYNMRRGRRYNRHHRRYNRKHYGRRRHNYRRRRYNRGRFRAAFRAAGRGRGFVGRVVIPAVAGGAGALTLDLAWGAITSRFQLPTFVQSGWGALGGKLGLIWGLSMLAVRFAPRRFTPMIHAGGLGAATVVTYTALKGVAQSVLPAGTPGLSGYMDYQSFALPTARMGGYMPRTTLGSLEDYYSPAAVIQPMGTPVPRQFGGYMQPHMSGGGGLMGLDWTNDGM